MQIGTKVLRDQDGKCPVVGIPSRPIPSEIMVIDAREPLSEQLARTAEPSVLSETQRDE
jgi:hypothetical protein